MLCSRVRVRLRTGRRESVKDSPPVPKQPQKHSSEEKITQESSRGSASSANRFGFAHKTGPRSSTRRETVRWKTNSTRSKIDSKPSNGLQIA
jgi:hypothetical protein